MPGKCRGHSPAPLKLALQMLHGTLNAAALQRERLFAIPPVRLLRFYHFLCNWLVLQDKLERKLETEADELDVSHLGPREVKNDTSNWSFRPPGSTHTLLCALKIVVEKNICLRKKTILGVKIRRILNSRRQDYEINTVEDMLTY